MIKIAKKSLLTVLWFGIACFAVPTCSFAHIEEDTDCRIKQLDEFLMLVGVPSVEKAGGKVFSRDEKPRRSFIFKRNFHAEIRRILRLFDWCEQHREFAECNRCVDAINEISYLQFHQLLVELKMDDANVHELSARLSFKGAPVDLSKMGKRDVALGYLRGKAKTRLLETLFKVYDCQNIDEQCMRYNYVERPLASVMTKEVIFNCFLARAHTRWSNEKRKDFLIQNLDKAKKRFSTALGRVDRHCGTDLLQTPNNEEIFDLIDVSKGIMIPTRTVFPFGIVCKWVFWASAVAGGIYAVRWLVTEMAKAGRNIGATGAQEFRSGARETGLATVQYVEQQGGIPIRLDADTAQKFDEVKASVDGVKESVDGLKESVDKFTEVLGKTGILGPGADAFFGMAATNKGVPVVTSATLEQKLEESIKAIRNLTEQIGKTGVFGEVGTKLLSDGVNLHHHLDVAHNLPDDAARKLNELVGKIQETGIMGERGSEFLKKASVAWFESEPGAFTKFLEGATKSWFAEEEGPLGRLLLQLAIAYENGETPSFAIEGNLLGTWGAKKRKKRKKESIVTAGGDVARDAMERLGDGAGGVGSSLWKGTKTVVGSAYNMLPAKENVPVVGRIFKKKKE